MLRLFIGMWLCFSTLAFGKYEAMKLEGEELRLRGNVRNIPVNGLALFDNGKFRVLLGCNEITGTYKKAENYISVNYINSTSKPCADSDIVRAEYDFMSFFFGKIEMLKSLNVVVLQRNGISLELRKQDPYEGGVWGRKWHWWERGYYIQRKIDREREMERRYYEEMKKQERERKNAKTNQNKNTNQNTRDRKGYQN